MDKKKIDREYYDETVANVLRFLEEQGQSELAEEYRNVLAAHDQVAARVIAFLDEHTDAPRLN